MMREGSLSQPFQLNSLNLPTPPHTHTPSFMISVLTDNPNRASAEVKNAVNKAGRGKAKMAESGSVSYLYERKGRIVLGKGEVDEEKVLDVCLEVGVEDFEFSEGEDDGSGEEADVVYTSQGDLALLRDGILEGQGVEARSAELCYKSKAPVVVGEEGMVATSARAAVAKAKAGAR